MKIYSFSQRIALVAIFIFICSNTFSQIIWQSQYAGSSSTSIDSAIAVIVNGTSNVFVTGVSNVSGSDADVITIRYDFNTGSELWNKKIKGNANQNDAPSSLTYDNSGFVYVTGWLYNTAGNRDMFVAKYNGTTGDTSWMRTYNGTGNGGDYSNAIYVDVSGNVYIAGRTDVGGAQKFAVLKYNSSGVLQSGWPYVYTGGLSTLFDEARGIKVDGSGDSYIAGNSGLAGTEDYLTIKINGSGALQWAKKYAGTSGQDLVSGLIIDVSNNVYVAGSTYKVASGFDMLTIKYNSNGDSIGAAIYNGPANGLDITQGITIDNSSNIIVIGYSQGSGTNADYATLKYNTSLAQQWIARYNGPGNLDYPNAVVINNTNGNIYVTGHSLGSGVGYDYFTIGYYMSDGSSFGNVRFNGTQNGNDRAYSVALAPSGEVFVTGIAINTTTGADWITFKYTSTLSFIKQISSEVPQEFSLMQNYPNPFNPVTYIRFTLPKPSHVTLAVYNILGEQVSVLVNQKLSYGTYEYMWNAINLPSGIYFYSLESNDFRETKKMILNK